MFDDIAKIYGIMKSGFNWGGSYHRSYLFEYFIDKKTGNEKGMYPTTGREQINISNSEFERLASPIFFKIIGDVIYMVPKRVNEKILGKTFYFKNTETNMSISIDVPDAFDIDDFMKYFADRYNKDSKQKNEKGFTVGYSIGKDIKYQETKKGDVI
jgi:hypothetical protein